MHIDFKALTVELTDDIRAYAQEKVNAIEKLVQNVDKESIRAEVDLSQKQNQQTGEIFRADITIFAGGERTHAVGHGESLQAAIDQAQEDLSRRIRRGKARRTDALREGGARIKRMLRFWE